MPREFNEWLIYPISLNIKNSREIVVLCGHSDKRKRCIFGIESVDVENGIIVSDEGDEYLLGDPHIKYQKKFPNARANLLKNLKERKCLDKKILM